MRNLNFAGKIFIGFILVMISTGAYAHVGLDYPQDGQTFAPGTKITIQWTELINHNTLDYDLYFSLDGGQNWILIKDNYPVHDEAKYSYDWEIPDVPAPKAQIKVIQENPSGNYQSVVEFSINDRVTDTKSITDPKFPFTLNNFVAAKGLHEISFDIDLMKRTDLHVQVYNETGQLMGIMQTGELPSGIYHYNYNISNVSSELYFLTIQSASKRIAKKFVFQ